MPSKRSFRTRSSMYLGPEEEQHERGHAPTKETTPLVRYSKLPMFNRDTMGVRFLGYAAGKPAAATMVKKSTTVIHAPSGRIRRASTKTKYWWTTTNSEVRHKIDIERHGGPASGILSGHPPGNPPDDYNDTSYETLVDAINGCNLRNLNVMDYLVPSESVKSTSSSVAPQAGSTWSISECSDDSSSSSEQFSDASTVQTALTEYKPWKAEYCQHMLPGIEYSMARFTYAPGLWPRTWWI